MSETVTPPHDPRIARRAALLLALTVVFVLGLAGYVMALRGVFAPTQQLTLIVESAEGIVEGMPLSFSGFIIGRVGRVSLAEDGSVRVRIDIPRDSARWLRESSVFTLERGALGDTRLRAYSGVLSDPPLPDGAERPVLSGDLASGVPQLLVTARQLLENLERLTAEGAALPRALTSAAQVGERATGPHGMLGALLGDETHARQVTEALARANRLLAQADARLFGNAPAGSAPAGAAGGLSGEVQAAVAEAAGLLRDARASLGRVDALLGEAQATARNVRGASEDLDALRHEVEAGMRRANALMESLQRRWPFAGEATSELP